MLFTSIVFGQYGDNVENKISAADKETLLKYHNIARAQVGSAPLTWDTTMEKAGLKCLQDKRPTKMTHGICKDTPGLEKVGENLASGGDGPGAAVMFIGEKCQVPQNSLTSYQSTYSFDDGTGHWSQVVWKDSQRMSCAQIVASGLIYCHYSPPGNVIGGKTYTKAPSNSDCKGGKFDKTAFLQSSTVQTNGAAPSGTAPTPTLIPESPQISIPSPSGTAPSYTPPTSRVKKCYSNK